MEFSTSDGDLTEFTCAGLLARQLEQVGSALDLAPRAGASSASILVRSQFDHAVTLAWIAAEDSINRVNEFRKQDARAQLAIENELNAIGESIMDQATREDLERRLEILPAFMPSLEARARLADNHWAGKIPGLEGRATHSFRGLYTLVYRAHSTREHASEMGLNEVVDEVSKDRRLVHMEVTNLAQHGPFGRVSILLALTLFITSQRFGWPADTAAINDAFRSSL